MKTVPVRRRALLALSSAAFLSGCETIGDWFTPNDKPKFPGKREALGMLDQSALTPDRGAGAVTLSAPVRNADYPQAGGTPAHMPGNQAGGGLKQIWQSSIGEGGGYRQRITAQPVVSGGSVFAMDSDGVATAFDVRTGSQQWQCTTQTDDNRSTNIGGGLGYDGGKLYVTTGRAELLRLDARSGKIDWRVTLNSPARSAPTIADGRVYFITLDSRLLAYDTKGKQLWEHRARQTDATTDMLGMPAPAIAGRLIIAGFTSGELTVMQADSGTLAWTDTLSAMHGGDSLLDVASITALPIVDDRTLYVVGMGGIMVAYDIPSGRRLWERAFTSEETPCLAGGWLFGINLDQQLAAFSAQDGKVAWVSALTRWLEPDKRRGQVNWHGPVMGNGKLILAGTMNKLVTVDAKTGQRGDDVDLPDAASLAPVIAGGLCFVVTDDGNLTAFQ